MTSPVRDPRIDVGGYDDDRFVLDDAGVWTIDAVRLTVWRRRGDEEIMERAPQRRAS